MLGQFHLVAAVLLACLVGESQSNEGFKYRFFDEFKHPCIRKCKANSTRLCEYEFNLEWYYVLSKACYNCPKTRSHCSKPHCVSADGVPRAIMAVNRQLPGPSVQVCEGDVVVVKVNNRLEGGEGTSIHWHGIHQLKTPWMDGVSKVTQCPITYTASFEYRFIADPAGTHFWHAHTGLQRGDGIFGNFVVRQDRKLDVHSDKYDEDLPEHAMMVHDWSHVTTVEKFARHHHTDSVGTNTPKSILVNGKGQYKMFEIDGQSYYTPRAVFNVTKGKRYRFRIASNAILYCPLTVSLEEHKLVMIASDGVPFKSFEVSSFVIYGGETFDFVVNANKYERNYNFKFQGEGDCGVDFTKAKQGAILHYTGADESYVGIPNAEFRDMKPENGIQLNPHNYKADALRVPVSKLTPIGAGLKDIEKYSKKPDHVFYAVFDFENVDNGHFNDPEYYPISGMPRVKHLYSTLINGIAHYLPPVPILYQYNDLDQKIVCQNNEQREGCYKNFCHCVHILKVDIGQLVEVILIDKGVIFNASHPFHIHGHYFRVVAIEKVGATFTVDQFKAMEKAGQIKRRFDGILKDTVVVPDGGYTIIRFLADNPGVWFFHCHLQFHLEIGMGLLFQIGNPDQWPKVPDNFERCGSWKATYANSKTVQPIRKEAKSIYQYNYFILVVGVISLLYYF